jgi:hypothetical protein
MGASPFPTVGKELFVWVVWGKQGKFSDPEEFVSALDHRVGGCSELFS